MKYLLKIGVLCVAASVAAPCICAPASSRIAHVLVISIDGMHAVDLRRYIEGHPQSTLAKLASQGIEYADAHAAVPADSFPGLIGMFTGATPAVSGVYYDVSYDRRSAATMNDCRSGRLGARVAYDESIDAPSTDGEAPGIDPHRLPLRAVSCTPMYPHDYLRANTVFEVVHAAGGYTAWIDKHPAYEILNGPSGHGLDDLYTPEIGGDFEDGAAKESNGVTGSLAKTEAYDLMKSRALIAQIDGWRHDRSAHAPVPTLFGMNMQSLNVAQKLYGYENSESVPTGDLAGALDHCDRLLGNLIDEMQQRRLLDSTLMIVTAKHGNAPIDPNRLAHVESAALRRTIDLTAPGALAQLTTDQEALVWLRDRGDTRRVASALRAQSNALGIRRVLVGAELNRLFPASRSDSRVPDIVIIPLSGVIYGKPGDKKLAEHGGFDDDDTHVGLLVSSPLLVHRNMRTHARVSTLQIAPTILAVLGIPPSRLRGVEMLGTKPLPDENWANHH